MTQQAKTMQVAPKVGGASFLTRISDFVKGRGMKTRIGVGFIVVAVVIAIVGYFNPLGVQRYFVATPDVSANDLGFRDAVIVRSADVPMYDWEATTANKHFPNPDLKVVYVVIKLGRATDTNAEMAYIVDSNAMPSWVLLSDLRMAEYRGMSHNAQPAIKRLDAFGHEVYDWLGMINRGLLLGLLLLFVVWFDGRENTRDMAKQVLAFMLYVLGPEMIQNMPLANIVLGAVVVWLLVDSCRYNKKWDSTPLYTFFAAAVLAGQVFGYPGLAVRVSSYSDALAFAVIAMVIAAVHEVIRTGHWRSALVLVLIGAAIALPTVFGVHLKLWVILFLQFVGLLSILFMHSYVYSAIQPKITDLKTTEVQAMKRRMTMTGEFSAVLPKTTIFGKNVAIRFPVDLVGIYAVALLAFTYLGFYA